MQKIIFKNIICYAFEKKKFTVKSSFCRARMGHCSDNYRIFVKYNVQYIEALQH